MKRQTRASRTGGHRAIIEEQMQEEEDEELEERQAQQALNDAHLNADGEGDDEFVNEIGVFFPDLDQILWRREKENHPGVYEYLVKYKDYSYLHLEWITASTSTRPTSRSTASSTRPNSSP